MILCQECQKSIATVHLTEIKSGQRQEKHLCENCARNMDFQYKQPVTIQELLGTLLEKSGQKESSKTQTPCPQCGITFAEFKNKGRLGCAYDYEFFGNEVENLLNKMHGSTRYVGKSPPGHNTEPIHKNELMKLKTRLKRVVSAEEYEEAARIRDRIIELEALIAGPEGSQEDKS